MSQAVPGNANNFVIINLSELITKLATYMATVSAGIIDVHTKLKSIPYNCTSTDQYKLVCHFEGNLLILSTTKIPLDCTI